MQATLSAPLKVHSLRTNIGKDTKAAKTAKFSSINPLLHQSDLAKNNWDSLRENFLYGPEWFQKFRDNFTQYLSYTCGGLNGLAALGSSLGVCPKVVAKFFNKKAEWFSRYSLPASYMWNGVEALIGNRPIESLIRFAPAFSFLVLPFYNFNLGTGISSGLNNLMDLVAERLGDKQPSHSMKENSKVVLGELKVLVKELLTTIKPLNAVSGETFIDQFATVGTILGNAGGLAFAAQQRNSPAAKTFCSLSNISGFALDLTNIFSKNLRKNIVGCSCAIASLSNIALRFSSHKLATILNHLAIAADTFGMTYWAQSSKEKNDVVS